MGVMVILKRILRMQPPDLIIDSLTTAAPQLHLPRVRDAYRQLTSLIGVSLLEQPLPTEQPLTPSQLVMLRHSLKGMSPAQTSPIAAAACDLRALIRPPHDDIPEIPEPPAQMELESGGTYVHTHIDTITGGNVSIVGVQNGVSDELLPLVVPTEPTQYDEVSGEMRWAHDVFISYSRRDAAIARRIYADLRQAGLLVWMDDQLTPGTPSWQQALESAIRMSGCVVVILTPDARKSEWMEREISTAMTHKVPIFPVIARGDEFSAVPFALSTYQWIGMRDNQEIRANMPKLIAAICSDQHG